MNAVEIEQAISDLAIEPFDAAEFAFGFLMAFGNKDTTLKRLRTGNHNALDDPGGVLLRNNIYMAVCEADAVGETLKSVRANPITVKAEAEFIFTTDGQTLEAEELFGGETINCANTDFPDHLRFFLPYHGGCAPGEALVPFATYRYGTKAADSWSIRDEAAPKWWQA